jgi:hypothetical protein
MASSRPLSPLPSADPAEGPTSDSGVADEVATLRAEVDRLQALVGPSEESYQKLRLDLLGARDAAIAAEAELGRLRSREVELLVQIAGYERDFDWFREQFVRRLLRFKQARVTRRLISRLARR